MMRPSPDDALSETARLAYHFHWPLDTILDLEHADRRRFLAEADALAGHPPAGGPLPASVDHPMVGHPPLVDPMTES
jgi:hypothetical protein